MVAIEGANGVNLADKLMAASQAAQQLNLQVLGGIWDVDAVVLRKALKQMNALVEQSVPGFSSCVLEGGVAKGAPFLVKSGTRVFLMKRAPQEPLCDHD